MRFGPLVVTFLTGALLIAIFFIPHHAAQETQSAILEWADIVYTFALVLGSISLWAMHQKKVQQRGDGWAYSLVTLIALLGVTLFGIIQGVEAGTVVGRVYNMVNAPLA